MGKSVTGKAIQTVVSSFWDGKAVLSMPKSANLRGKLNEAEVSLLSKFTRLIMLTDFVGESSKLYFSRPENTISGVYKSLYGVKPTRSYDQIRNRLYYDIKKIQRHMGGALVDILVRQKYDFAAFSNAVNQLYTKHFNMFRLEDHLILNISKIADTPKQTTITDCDFTDFLRAIKPYTKPGIKEAEGRVGNALGYIKYLTNTQDSLDGIDLDRLERLKRVATMSDDEDFMDDNILTLEFTDDMEIEE